MRKIPRWMSIEEIEAELVSTTDDDRFAELEEELCERRSEERMADFDHQETIEELGERIDALLSPPTGAEGKTE